MDQSSPSPEPRGPQDPEPPAGGTPSPGSPSSPPRENGAGPGRRPSATLVASGLLLLVLLLALGAFFGTRAYLSGDGDAVQRPTMSRATSAPIWSSADREAFSTPLPSTASSSSRPAEEAKDAATARRMLLP